MTEGALGYACRRLEVPPAEAYGVATFYALIALEERPAEVLHVCTDLSCRLAGYELPEGAHPSPCLGLCERAPAALRTVAGEEPREIQIPATGRRCRSRGSRACACCAASRTASTRSRSTPTAPPAATRRCAARSSSGPSRCCARSRSRACSAAAARRSRPASSGRRSHASPRGPHYLVCNADESEPGTFKDRVLMEQDPFALVEAMTIAAYATGCEHGFLYVRAEYPLAHERLENAFAQARAHGLLGDDVMGSGFAFDIELRIGAGAYVCGEETALFQSIEGYRGEPRNKPPFPVEVGLFGKPTVVNNVETLFNVLDVVSGHRARRTRRPAPRARPARGSSASRATSGAPASTRCRSGRRCASCSSSPRRGPEGRAARRRRRLVPAARPARPAAHVRGRAPRARRSARAS